MIAYEITVREHETGEVVDRDRAAGNTDRTAQAAKRALMRQLDWQYPPQTYALEVRKVAA